MFETSHIELSRLALQNNLRFIRKNLKPGVRLCSIVKGNAYGHGLSEFVRMAMEQGIDYFGVHAVEEAYTLFHHLEKMPDVFIMGEISGEAIRWAIEHGIEFSVFDLERFEQAVEAAKLAKKKAKIHIEIETGMYRTGFESEHIAPLCDRIKKQAKHLQLQGIFTHYAGAESEANAFRITKQIHLFEAAAKVFKLKNLNPLYTHSACSAAMLNYPETQGNMVRIGILQYGFWPNKETQIRFNGEKNGNPSQLKRIIKWSSRVMSVKEVKKGQFIGYGTSFLAYKNMKLAIIPIGYAHGYSRSLSNVGAVLINGKSCPVVATVNMNSLSVDISSAGPVKKDDEVVLIGKQKDKAISVNSFSEQSLLLNYEMLTRLPIHIPRKITN